MSVIKPLPGVLAIQSYDDVEDTLGDFENKTENLLEHVDEENFDEALQTVEELEADLNNIKEYIQAQRSQN